MTVHVLLLTTFFPPANTIAAHRMFGFAEYLPKFGVEVTVVTVTRPGNFTKQPERAHVVRLYEDHSPVNRFVKQKSPLRTLLHLTGLRPVRNFYFGSFSRAFAKHFHSLAHEHYDAVIASYGPEDVLRAGEIVHDRAGIPLVLDFRDPWLQNHYFGWTPLESQVIRKIQQRLLRKASLITTVSQTLAETFSEDGGSVKAEVIYNGFYGDFPKAQTRTSASATRSNGLTVCYCGSLYGGIQPIDIFLKGLRQCPDVKFTLALLDPQDRRFVENLGQRLRVESQLQILELLPYHASLELQNRSDVLLFLNRADGTAKGVLTGKLFEYFSTGNFVLGIGHPSDEARKLIETYRNGVYVNTAEEVAKVLGDLPRYRKPASDMSFFTRENQAKRLAELLKQALGRI